MGEHWQATHSHKFTKREGTAFCVRRAPLVHFLATTPTQAPRGAPHLSERRIIWHRNGPLDLAKCNFFRCKPAVAPRGAALPACLRDCRKPTASLNSDALGGSAIIFTIGCCLHTGTSAPTARPQSQLQMARLINECTLGSAGWLMS